jgi:hypothetical protein
VAYIHIRSLTGFLRDEPTFLAPVRDIEELVEAGRQHRCDPTTYAHLSIDTNMHGHTYLHAQERLACIGLPLSLSICVVRVPLVCEGCFSLLLLLLLLPVELSGAGGDGRRRASGQGVSLLYVT